jgi:hypothetical protein
MQSESNTAGAGSWWQRHSRGKFKTFLWLLNGALLGALAYSLASQHLESRRLNQARREVADLFNTLTPKLEQQLGTAGRLQDELKGELLSANFASASDSIKPSVLRPKARRIKSQLDAAELALKRFTEESADVGTRHQLRRDAQLFDPTQRQQFEALAMQLDDYWQELAGLETQLDWAGLHWSQLVEKEKQAQEWQAQSAAEEVRRLAAALQRSQEEADRARVDSLHQAAIEALRQPQSAPSMTQVVYPAPPQPPMPVGYLEPAYGIPAYYSPPPYYPGRWGRNRPSNCNYNYDYNYNWRYPNVHRFGAYLVIN